MASPTTLTPESAIAYVRETIAGWGAEWVNAEIGDAHLSRMDDTDVAIVPTTAGEWVVWVSGDGSLYGEV